jgi:hypothetical protein
METPIETPSPLFREDVGGFLDKSRADVLQVMEVIWNF